MKQVENIRVTFDLFEILYKQTTFMYGLHGLYVLKTKTKQSWLYS